MHYGVSILIVFLLLCVNKKHKEHDNNQELFITEAFKIAGLLTRMFEIDQDYRHHDNEWFECYNELKDMWKKENDN